MDMAYTSMVTAYNRLLFQNEAEDADSSITNGTGNGIGNYIDNGIDNGINPCINPGIHNEGFSSDNDARSRQDRIVSSWIQEVPGTDENDTSSCNTRCAHSQLDVYWTDTLCKSSDWARRSHVICVNAEDAITKL